MVKCKTIISVLDGLLFLGLCSAATAFIWQALIQYESKDTSYKRAEVPVVDFPTLSFCLPLAVHTYFDWGPPYDYMLGKDFNISYFSNGTWLNISSVGQKYHEVTSETILVEQIATYYNCYRVSATALVWKGSARGVKLNFNQSIPEDSLPGTVHTFITSEDNVYSITFQKRMNGNMLQYDAKMGHWIMLSLKAEKFVYLKETSNCTELTFWEQWEPIFSNWKGFDDCPKRCSPITLPNLR